ncbi:MAG: hypothetical protein KBD01_03965 [Acidobacteria bacterium]|nr:hypothetical protein [Acidobacteriota bacterium]
MAAPKELRVCCPFCKGKLTVHPETGDVIDAERPEGSRKDFEAALGELRTADQKREQDFLRAFSSERKREEVLEQKFEKAREKAAKDPKKPFNPMDMD